MGTIISQLVFSAIMLCASIRDLKTHTISNRVYPTIFFLGLLHLAPVFSFMGALITGLPLYITALITEDKIGGGDVKLMVAVGFYLGAERGFTALLLGLFLIVVYGYTLGYQKRKRATPLVPFFGVSSVVALLF